MKTEFSTSMDKGILSLFLSRNFQLSLLLYQSRVRPQPIRNNNHLLIQDPILLYSSTNTIPRVGGSSPITIGRSQAIINFKILTKPLLNSNRRSFIALHPQVTRNLERRISVTVFDLAINHSAYPLLDRHENICCLLIMWRHLMSILLTIARQT